MKIIIEGADGTGKTTLIKKIIQKFNIKSYIHINRHDPNTYNFYYETVKKNDVIFDRHLIGEMIYPKVFNRKANLNKQTFEMLLKHIEDEKCIIIILYTNNENLISRLKFKTDEYDEVIKNILEINRQFLEIAAKYNIKIFDTSQVTYKEIFNWIEVKHGELNK
jgi:broad-specificity NMP kinase